MSYMSPVFDVSKYGAIGDGSTNDYTAINNALTAALAVDGVLYFPKGRYRINTVLSFSNGTNNITLKGDGPNVSILVAGSSNNGINFNFNQGSGNQIGGQPYGVVVEDLGFQAIGGAGTAITVSANVPNLTTAGSFVTGLTYAIVSPGNTNFTLIGAPNNNAGTAFIATGPGSGTGTANGYTNDHYRPTVTVRNVRVESDSNNGNYWANGIDITSCWNVCMTDCFISGSSQGGVWNNLSGYGIALHRSCVNSHFLNCHCNFWAAGFYYDTGNGSYDHNTEGIMFANCSFVAVKKGVWITGNANNVDAPRVALVTWTGGLIELRVSGVSSGSAAFQCVNVWDVMISGMMCVTDSLATTSYAFYVQDCQNVTVKGCSVYSFTYGTYSANTCVSINTIGNVFTNCATQTKFTSGTSKSISGGHTLSNNTPSESNEGGGTNRVYSGSSYGAMLYLTSAQSVPNATDDTISWDAAYYDDLAIWSGGDPTKLSIPTGVTRVRASAGMRWASNSSGERKIRIRSNPGGAYSANAIWAAAEHPTGASGDSVITTGIIDVRDLTYFDLVVTQNSGGALNTLTEEGVWFQLEVLG